jgi:hypothetical protein
VLSHLCQPSLQLFIDTADAQDIGDADHLAAPWEYLERQRAGLRMNILVKVFQFHGDLADDELVILRDWVPPRSDSSTTSYSTRMRFPTCADV